MNNLRKFEKKFGYQFFVITEHKKNVIISRWKGSVYIPVSILWIHQRFGTDTALVAAWRIGIASASGTGDPSSNLGCM
jgi:hypothetical protein